MTRKYKRVPAMPGWSDQLRVELVAYLEGFQRQLREGARRCHLMYQIEPRQMIQNHRDYYRHAVSVIKQLIKRVHPEHRAAQAERNRRICATRRPATRRQ